MTASALPHHNPDAERAVLGAMLRFPAAIDEAGELLRPEHFYLDAHQKIFRAVLDLAAKTGGKVEAFLLADELLRYNQLADVGSAAYLGDLLEAATFGSVGPSAEIIRREAERREQEHILRECLGRLANHGADPAAEREHLLRLVFQSADAATRSGPVPDTQVAKESLDRIDQRSAGQVRGVPTGFGPLDMLTGGLHPGELTVLAARTSVGKTAFALSLAEHVALAQGRHVLFVSLEMLRIDLFDRLLCQAAEVRGHAIRTGEMPQEDMIRLIVAAGRYHGTLHIDDTRGQTITQISSTARRHHRRVGLDLLVIDYLGFIESEATSRRERYEEIGWMTRRLKMLAGDLRIPVLLLAQLNREVENRSDHRPRPSDLRESGDIEQNADTIILLHRPEMYADRDKPEADRDRSSGEVEVIIGKQRNGPTGSVVLMFDREYMRFRECDPLPSATFFSRPTERN